MNKLKSKIASTIVVFMLLMGYNANAQKRTFQRVKAGYSHGMPKLSLDKLGELEAKSSHGFYANYSLEIRFAERFAYFMDLSYEQIHSEFTPTLPTASVKNTNGSLNVALGLKFYPIYNLGIYAGGFGGFNLVNNIAISSDTIKKDEINDLEEAFDKSLKSGYGLRFGADYRFVDNWFVEVSYSWGNNQEIKQARTLKEIGNYRLSYISAGIGYRF